MRLNTRALTPGFGVEICDVDLVSIDAELADAIMDALIEHALLLFRRQSLHDPDIFRICSAFGPVEEPAAKQNHSPAYKEINYISNLLDQDGRSIGGLTRAHEAAGVWHTDQAFRREPATLSTLFCVVATEQGGGTGFISTTLGYEALPDELASRAATVRGRYLPSAVHDIDKIEVSHPAVLENPRSGRRSLYVAPNTRGFEGLSNEEGEQLKDRLLTYQMREKHGYTHEWRMGDMLIYDNAQLLHRREAFRGMRWLKATRTFAPRDRFAVPL